MSYWTWRYEHVYDAQDRHVVSGYYAIYPSADDPKNFRDDLLRVDLPLSAVATQHIAMIVSHLNALDQLLIEHSS